MASGEDLNPKGAAGRAKPQMHLIPVAALECVARVMELGAKKYGPYNWRETPVNYTTYLSADMRHGAAFLDGQDQDPESGQSHLAHKISSMLILLDAIVTGNAKDDRPPKNPAYVEPAPEPPNMAAAAAAAMAKVREVFFWWNLPETYCECEPCVMYRGLLAEKPSDSGAENSTAAGEETAP